MRTAAGLTALAVALGAAARNQAAPKADTGSSLAAFETVRKVFQHPRCQNCHIPGDAPLQFDDGRTHGQNVKRGPDGQGAAGLPCAAHGVADGRSASPARRIRGLRGRPAAPES